LQIDSSSHSGRSYSGQTFGFACRVSGQIQTNPFDPFHHLTRRSFEPYSSKFRWWNLLGCIQCSKRGANPPGVQIQCRRGQIRDPTDIHSSLEARALLLEQFRAHSDSGFFRSSFPASSGYRISPKSHIFADLSVHASNLLSSYDHEYFLLFDCIPVHIQEI
jgi:hypothetical protein